MSLFTSAASLLYRTTNRGLTKQIPRKLLQSAVLCTNLHGCMAAITLLLCPGLRCVLRHNPRTPFKFVGNYISLSLSSRNRLGIILHHYRFLNACFSSTFASDILREPLTLWQSERADNTYSIEIILSEFDLEGDLSLVLKKNGKRVSIISFTIVPGEVLDQSGKHALFISRIQGAKDFEMIRSVTKALGEISPPTILLTAARAIATAAGLDFLAGVSSSAQVTVGEEEFADQARFFNYDEFWHSKGGVLMEKGFFRLAVTPHSKPVEEIKGKHRTRTLRKRQFEDEVLEKCRRRFAETCLKKDRSSEYEFGKTAALTVITGMSTLC